jgi:hypothetical protein
LLLGSSHWCAFREQIAKLLDVEVKLSTYLNERQMLVVQSQVKVGN